MVSRGLSLLAEACAALAEEQHDSLSNAEIAENVSAIHHGITLLEAQRSRSICTFDRRKAFDAPASSTVGWLRRTLRITGPAAASLVKVARILPRLRSAQKAFERGEMALPHARAIVDLVEDAGIVAARTVEPILVESARTYDAAAVRNIAYAIRESVDPAGAQADADKQFEARWLHVDRTLRGVVHLEGRLCGEDGAMLVAALDSLMMPVPGDTRTARQRWADALGELGRRQLGGGELPQRGGRKPHTSLTVSIDKLLGDRLAPPPNLSWVGSITVDEARRIACDARVSTVIVDRNGQPLVFGPEVEMVPPPLRRALTMRDGGCVNCGCPESWCDAHHLVHRVDGGDMELANLGLLCRACHRMVHRRELTLRRTGDGGWELLEHDGRLVARRDPVRTLRELIGRNPRLGIACGIEPATLGASAVANRRDL